jgi:flagellar M-ring protein FliF
VNGLLGTFKKLGGARLLTIGIVGLAVIGFFAFLMTRLSTPNMALLYGELEADDASRIVAKLDAMGVPYELAPDGSFVMVPDTDIAGMRLAMAKEGLPSGGSIGYELFDRSEGFGTTTAVQDVNRLRAMEGELARTIRTINGVRNARVHLVLPRRTLFSRDKEEPSASIVLNMHGAGRLGGPQVRAVQHLVAAAVPGLQPSRISVIDEQGNLLARGELEGGAEDGATGQSDEMRRSFEVRMSRTIESLLERSIGPGRVRAEVTADMDFDRMTTTSELYDPNGQVIRSTQTIEEAAISAESASADTVSVGQNVPGVGLDDEVSDTTSNTTTRNEEVVNYEVSKTIQNHVREAGTVRRLSVAVLVDGVYAAGAGGAPVYEPRSAAEMEQIATLVRSAIGFDEARGDAVEVINMPFARPDEISGLAEAPSFFNQFNLRGYARIAETVGLIVVALLILLLVVRPFVTKVIIEGMRAQAQITEASNQIASEAGQQAALEQRGVNPELEEMIDVKKVEGSVRASSLKKIGEIVERHPEEAVAIVRSWMYEKA